MPITIAICDDDHNQTKYLRSLLSEWSADKPFAADIAEYESAEEFLFKYPDNPCDLLLLDIEMNGINGMELAKKLRSNGDMLPIVFVTGFSDFISDGYDVEALHYLMKPVNEEKLVSVLDKYIRSHIVKSAEILVSSNGNAIHISVDRITYAEAFGHSTTLYLTDGEALPADLSIGGFAEKACGGFIQCHRSYIVNLRYIKSIGKTAVILDNGAEVPLSRRLYNEVNQSFIRFYSKGSE